MIDVRKAEITDIKAINQIHLDVFEKDRLKDLEKVILNPVYHLFVATINGEVAGYFEISIVTDEAEIIFIATKEKYRHQGVADYMMQFIIGYAKLKGAKSIFLEVESSNIPAFNLYEKFNFTHIYNRADYYGKDRNAIVMRKDI